MIAGSSDHAAIEMSMVQKIKTYSDLPVYDVQERFITEMQERVDEVGLSDLEVKKGQERLTGVPAKRKELDRLTREGTTLVGAYQTVISPTVQPTAVEEAFELSPVGFPVKVVGRLDLVGSVNEGTPRIIDRKRRGGSSRKAEPEWVVQGRVYQLVREIPHDWHVTFVKSGRIQAGGDGYTILPEPRWKTERMLSDVIADIGHYMVRYGPDDPWPAKGQLHTWACNYCAFRDDKTCWAYKEA